MFSCGILTNLVVPFFLSEAKSCLKDEAIVCEESDHCGSSTSEEDKEESGIEQDLEPKTKKPLTEVKRELRSQIKTSGKPLVPLVFSTLRPKNGLKATEKRSSCGVPCHNMDPRSTESGCVPSSRKSSIFIPSINSRQQYPRKPLTITSTKRLRRSKNSEMFGDILIKNDLRTRSLYQSPKRQDIVKRSSDSKPRLASAAAYATRKKKNKTIASKDTSLGRSAGTQSKSQNYYGRLKNNYQMIIGCGAKSGAKLRQPSFNIGIFHNPMKWPNLTWCWKTRGPESFSSFNSLIDKGKDL